MATKSFGAEMRRLRIEAQLTLKDLATLWDVSIPYVSDIERGRRNPPSLGRIRSFADACGCPEAVDALAALAVKEKGEISLAPKNEETRELLVALNREIEVEKLDRETIEKIKAILNRRQSK